MQPRIIPRSDHSISRRNIDPDALKVLYRLYRSGHTAFLVGGGVRDLLIGRRPKDFDISTSARPGQVKKLFRNCWLIGRRFRLAHIHFMGHKIVEVSTFRAEPQQEADAEDILVRQDNTFGTPEQDALRRDFTINGLFYDIASFSLIDYVGGVDDIEQGVVRTIGEPSIRFREDPVRMIRAIKFAARLDFAIEPETWEAICEHAEEIRKCSTARVLEEIARLMEGGAFLRSVQLLKASGLLRIVLPEVWEYLQGVPAGPGLRPEGRQEGPRRTEEDAEVDLLLHADEDVDHEAQERALGAAPPDDELDGGELEEDLDDVEDRDDDLDDEGADAGDLDDEYDVRGDDDAEDDEVEIDGIALEVEIDRIEAETDEVEVDDAREAEADEDFRDAVAELLEEFEEVLEGSVATDEPEAGLEDVDRVLDAAPRRGRRTSVVVERSEDVEAEQPDTESVEEEDVEEEIVLGDDDEGDEPAVLTPQGTRVPQAPDRGALLWRTLSAVDQVVRSGRTLTRPTLFAGMFSPMLVHTAAWRAEREGGDPEQYVMALLRPLTASVVITRRDRERVCQILAAQRKFQRERRGSTGQFARKPYFAESLDLFEVRVLADGQGLDDLIWWRDRYPPIAMLPPAAGRGARLPEELEAPQERFGRRRRRGRGRGRGEGGERERRLDGPDRDLDRGDRGGPRGDLGDRGPRGDRGGRGRVGRDAGGRDVGERGRGGERGRDGEERLRGREATGERGGGLGERGRGPGERGRGLGERGRDAERGRLSGGERGGRRSGSPERGRRDGSRLPRIGGDLAPDSERPPRRRGGSRTEEVYREAEPGDSNRRRPRRRRPPTANR